MPPRLPTDAIRGMAAYPAVNKAALAAWLAEMQAGYRVMRPWQSFKSQVRTYADKIHMAEVDLRRIIFTGE